LSSSFHILISYLFLKLSKLDISEFVKPRRYRLRECTLARESGISACVRSAEAKEAFTAFLEKRRPSFSGAKNTPRAVAA